MEFISIGLLVCDIIAKPVTAKSLRKDSTPVETTILPGGDACNVAVNAAALGMKSGVISVVGKDPNGNYLKNYLNKCGVATEQIKTVEGWGTATSIVLVEPGGERHFLSSTEIFSQLLPEQVTRELLKDAKVLSLNSCYRLPKLDDGGVVETFRMARQMGVLTAMDTAWNRQGAWLPRIQEALRHTDVFLPSYQEAVQITEQTDVKKMREVMRPFGLKIFGVKMGGEGSYITDFSKEYFIEPLPVKEVVNTVGAGDSYVAGFLVAQAKGMGLYESGRFATMVASFAVQAMGAVGAVPPFEEILRQMKVS